MRGLEVVLLDEGLGGADKIVGLDSEVVEQALDSFLEGFSMTSLVQSKNVTYLSVDEGSLLHIQLGYASWSLIIQGNCRHCLLHLLDLRMIRINELNHLVSGLLPLFRALV